MLSILEITDQLGGMIGRTLTTVAVPIPGAGIILAPVGAAAGEVVGRLSPKMKKSSIPKFARDSVEIYKAGGEKNVSLSTSDQVQLRKDYIKKADELGYNKLGQAVAAIDPGLVSVTPNILIKKSEVKK